MIVKTICGHRRGFFHRKVDIKCVVTGYIERTSPVYLRAQGNRIEAEVKLGWLGIRSGCTRSCAS